MHKIKTNHQFRELVLGWDVIFTPEENEQFDYLTCPERDASYFFRYKGFLYCTDQFMRGGPWDAFLSESANTAILIQLSEDGEQVKVGTTC